ncbi:MAG: isoprenylcysteine carboxylmethyltransferase family protein [Blastocatellia bacterium]|nr:isoprenylcysteine carboxylmethyltransferase family protein [Blastocatellia bacterium]
MTETALKIFLPIYFLAWFALAFAWRSYLTWKRTGRNPYRLGKSDNAHDFVGVLFRLTMVVSAGVVLLHSLSSELYGYFAPIAWLQHPTLVTLGVVLLLVSFLWILLAQKQMGDSWRIGIDHEVKTPLVREGVFKLSRNPIFLGMRLNLLGLFLILPNAVTLSVLILGDALMQIQVRLEEEYLGRMHGQEYEYYRRQTRRWL